MNSQYLHNFEALKQVYRDAHPTDKPVIQWAINVVEESARLVDGRSWPRYDSDIRDLEYRLEENFD